MLGGLRVFFSNVRSVPLANMPAIFAGGAGGHARRRQQSVFHPGLSVPVGTGGEQGRENIFHASLQASPGNKRTRSQRATGADAAPLANPPQPPSAGGTHGDVLLFFTLPRLASSGADASCCSQRGRRLSRCSPTRTATPFPGI